MKYKLGVSYKDKFLCGLNGSVRPFVAKADLEISLKQICSNMIIVLSFRSLYGPRSSAEFGGPYSVALYGDSISEFRRLCEHNAEGKSVSAKL
jgi:hypothetical protein